MIYIGEKRKRREGAARIGVGIGKRRKIAGKEILFKKTFSTLSIKESTRAEGRILGKRWRSAQEQKREIAAKVLPGTLSFIIIIISYYFGIPVYIHLRFSGCFREVVLADWSGH